MSFIDKVTVSVNAGKGGDGKLNFRHEKFIDKGGPDGGDGGDGGHVILQASRNQNTLGAFRYQKELKAPDGHPGDKNRKHGRRAKNLMVPVPVGTVATSKEGVVLADMTTDGQEVVIAKGGRGGFGNAHFVSSRRQTPRFAEKGEPGEDYAEVKLELKMIADVGLVGQPNAGKSTLLARISNARPEIADYAFTTLRPKLGVVDIDATTSILVADIPGLIEGAAEGKGLGHDFLRHVERTAVIVHLIDCYQDDIAVAYHTIKHELAAYQAALAERPEIIALNKIDGLDDEMIDDLVAQLKAAAPQAAQIFAISAASGAGLKELLFAVKDLVASERAKVIAEIPEEAAVPVLTITDTSAAWNVTKKDDDFFITGQKIEQFARRTHFDNEEGVQRLRDIMRKTGIMHELTRSGVEAGNRIQIGKDPDQSFEY